MSFLFLFLSFRGESEPKSAFNVPDQGLGFLAAFLKLPPSQVAAYSLVPDPLAALSIPLLAAV